MTRVAFGAEMRKTATLRRDTSPGDGVFARRMRGNGVRYARHALTMRFSDLIAHSFPSRAEQAHSSVRRQPAAHPSISYTPSYAHPGGRNPVPSLHHDEQRQRM